jgi:hypothetical protein
MRDKIGVQTVDFYVYKCGPNSKINLTFFIYL